MERLETAKSEGVVEVYKADFSGESAQQKPGDSIDYGLEEREDEANWINVVPPALPIQPSGLSIA